MNMEEEEFSPYGAFSSGCDIHGEDFLRECTMCGIEFCSACFPNSALCSDCAAQGDLDDLDDEAPTEEEKELLLLEKLPEDEPDLAGEIPVPPPPVMKTAPTPKASPGARGRPRKSSPAAAKPAAKAKPESKAKARPKQGARAGAKSKARPRVKTKIKARPKAQGKASRKSKPRAKPAPKKRKR